MPENTIAVLSAKQKISAKQKASVLQKMQMKKEERKLEQSKSPAEKAEITPFFVLAAVIMLAMAVISLIIEKFSALLLNVQNLHLKYL